MKEYKVGDKVYHAWTGIKEISRPCPICFGKRKVTLILGNEDTVILDCSYCSRGYESSSGLEYFNEHIVEVKPETITEVRIEENEKGRKIGYLSNNYILQPEDTFDNEEDARLRSLQLVIDRNKADMLALAQKEKVDRSYAWNAGYHLKSAKRAQTDYEYHSKKAVIMESKAK